MFGFFLYCSALLDACVPMNVSDIPLNLPAGTFWVLKDEYTYLYTQDSWNKDTCDIVIV